MNCHEMGGLVMGSVLLATAGCGPSRRPLLPVAARMTPAVLPERPKLAKSFPREDRSWPIETLSNGLRVVRIASQTSSLAVVSVISPRQWHLGPAGPFVVNLGATYLDQNSPPGIRFSARQRDRTTQLTAWTSPDSLPEALHLLATTCAGRVLPRHFWEHHHRHLQALAENTKSYPFRTAVVLRRTRYGLEHPWSADAWHQVDRLSHLTQAQFQKDLARQFPANHSALVVIAPQDILPSRQTLETEFQYLSRAPPSFERLKIPPAPREGTLTFQAFAIGSDQAYVRILHVGPGDRDPRARAAFEILGRMFASFLSRFNQEFRHQEGQTYGLHAQLIRRGMTTELFWGGWINERSVYDVVNAYRDHLRSLHEGHIDHDAFRRAVARARAARLRSLGHPVSTAYFLATPLVESLVRSPSLGPHRQASLTDAESPHYRQLQPQDVVQVVKTYIPSETLNFAVAGSPKLLRRLSRWGWLELFELKDGKDG